MHHACRDMGNNMRTSLPSPRLRCAHAELRRQMKVAPLNEAQQSRLSELRGEINAEKQRTNDNNNGGVGSTSRAAPVPVPVVHHWVFESDTPRLSKGELPTWRVTNINDALDIDVGRRRWPEIVR